MKIYYFTRTGRSEKIANEIATANGVEAYKITDDIEWGGAGNFVKGGYMSSTKKIVPVNYEPTGENEEIVIVFPLWAAGFPPAVLSFLEKEGRGKVTAVVTSLMNTLKDREGFVKIYDLVGKEIQPPKELL